MSLCTVDRPPVPIGFEPPPPPPGEGCDRGRRRDPCLDCPVRIAMRARQRYMEQVPRWATFPLTLDVLQSFGVQLLVTPDDAEYVKEVIMRTHIGTCDGPVKERRQQLPMPQGRLWQFGRWVLRCSNVLVSPIERERYFREVGSGNF